MGVAVHKEAVLVGADHPANHNHQNADEAQRDGRREANNNLLLVGAHKRSVAVRGAAAIVIVTLAAGGRGGRNGRLVGGLQQEDVPVRCRRVVSTGRLIFGMADLFWQVLGQATSPTTCL